MSARTGFVSVAAILVLSTLFMHSNELSAASSGSKCVRVGQVQKTKGIEFSCKRVGNILKWVRKPNSSTSSTTPTAVSDSLLLAANPQSPEPLSNCRLPDVRTTRFVDGWQAITYPAQPNNGFVNAGSLDVAVVFVDFPDVVGGATELSDHISEIKKAADWYSWFSQGSVKYNLSVANTWARAPKTSEYFYWLHPGKPGVQLQTDLEIANTYRSLAGSVMDTSGVTSVWAILPKAISKIDEGFAYRAYPGVFSIGSDSYKAGTPIWQHFVHETLHSHGALGHSPKNTQIGLFWNTGSPGATLNSWDAMTLGWMKQENVYCVSKENLVPQKITLVPLEREQSGLRSVIIKTSEHEALVIESHRKDKWSLRWPTGTTGVSIMKVDTSLDTVWDLGASTSKYLIPEREHSLDFLKSGQSFIVDGIKITLVSAGSLDQVFIEKLN